MQNDIVVFGDPIRLCFKAFNNLYKVNKTIIVRFIDCDGRCRINAKYGTTTERNDSDIVRIDIALKDEYNNSLTLERLKDIILHENLHAFMSYRKSHTHPPEFWERLEELHREYDKIYNEEMEEI